MKMLQFPLDIVLTVATVALVFSFLAGLGFAVPWTTMLESGNGMTSCFIFAEGKAVAYASDDIKYDICVEQWTYPGWCTNYIDMGTVSLDSLTIPPASGYNDDVKGYEDCQKVEANHAYWIKTRDGKYAKVKVTEATHVESESGSSGNLNRVTFNWIYLGDTTASGSGNKDRTTDKPCPMAALGLVILSISMMVNREID